MSHAVKSVLQPGQPPSVCAFWFLNLVDIYHSSIHRSLEEFSRNSTPSNELQIYTWYVTEYLYGLFAVASTDWLLLEAGRTWY